MVLCALLRIIGRLLLGLAEVIEFVGEPSAAQTGVLIFVLLLLCVFLGWLAQIIW